MKELSLNILDITYNSIAAKAKNIEILIGEDTKNSTLKLVIKDDGSGMDEETVRKVTDPFYTSRTTRKIGLGIPLLKMEAEQTGGSLDITSGLGKGTELSAVFRTDSIDMIPLGEIIPTICTLIQGAPDIDYLFIHTIDDRTIKLDTKEIREALLIEPNDPDSEVQISLAEPEILDWIKEELESQYNGDSEDDN